MQDTLEVAIPLGYAAGAGALAGYYASHATWPMVALFTVLTIHGLMLNASIIFRR